MHTRRTQKNLQQLVAWKPNKREMFKVKEEFETYKEFNEESSFTILLCRLF